jgi:hypothetical protein
LSDERLGEEACIKGEGASPIMSLIKRKVMAAMTTTRGYTSGRFILVLSSEELCE